MRRDFHHTTCESTCDTLLYQPPTRGDNTVSVAQRGTATPGATKQLLLPERPDIGLGVRVFANGPGDLGSIPGRVIPKTQKMVLDASLLNTQHYKVRIKGKVEQSREGVAPSPTPWCSSYRKGSLRVTLDYGSQLYLLIYIYICLCVCVCVCVWCFQ